MSWINRKHFREWMFLGANTLENKSSEAIPLIRSEEWKLKFKGSELARSYWPIRSWQSNGLERKGCESKTGYGEFGLRGLPFSVTQWHEGYVYNVEYKCGMRKNTENSAILLQNKITTLTLKLPLTIIITLTPSLTSIPIPHQHNGECVNYYEIAQYCCRIQTYTLPYVLDLTVTVTLWP